MSEDVRTGRGRTVAIAAWIVVPILLLAALLVMTLRNTGKPKDDPKDHRGKLTTQENTLVTVRDTLARRVDLATCRAVVSQLNAHLQRAGAEHAVPALAPAAARRLKEQLGLDDGDLAELTSPTFTPLDAFHLESCFLLRDAARSLELVAPAGRGGKPVKLSPLERAVLAFDWTVREVRLVLPLDPTPVPPDFALRRGTGTVLERSLVFLSLLEQFGADEDRSAGLQGCLLFVPGENKAPVLWACGVVSAAEPGTMYLFDPRLGLPLPGPQGKGVATLAQARSEPAVLDQLGEGKLAYDVTAARAKSATAAVFVPLTALAPRMRLLQDRLLRDRAWQEQTLPPPVRVRLAENAPGALTSIQKAVQAAGGKDDDVQYWRGAKILRGFVPKEEGGASMPVKFELRRLRGFLPENDPTTSQMPRRQLHQFAAVPWENFPPAFRSPEQFNPQSGLGRELRLRYATPFLRNLLETSSPRDLMLRGQFRDATPSLVLEQEQWQNARLRRQEAEAQGNQQKIVQGVQQWLERAFEIFAAEARGEDVREQKATLWVRRGKDDPFDVFFNGAIAELRVGELTYQLGLCKHEEAIRLQVRLDLADRAGVRQQSDVDKARVAWEQADAWWKQCLQDPRCPGPDEARRLHGEALLHLGKRDEAARVWRSDLTGLPDLSKLARLWLARRASASTEAN
jgi:hypothetical protein